MSKWMITLSATDEFFHGLPRCALPTNFDLNSLAGVVRTINGIDRDISQRRFGCAIRGAKYFARSIKTVAAEVGSRAQRSLLFAKYVDLSRTHIVARLRFYPKGVLSLVVALEGNGEFKSVFGVAAADCLDGNSYQSSHVVAQVLLSDNACRGVEFPSVRDADGRCYAMYFPNEDVETLIDFKPLLG